MEKLYIYILKFGRVSSRSGIDIQSKDREYVVDYYRNKKDMLLYISGFTGVPVENIRLCPGDVFKFHDRSTSGRVDYSYYIYEKVEVK